MASDCTDYKAERLLERREYGKDIPGLSWSDSRFSTFSKALETEKSEEARTLWDVLVSSEGIRASDPRDLIYARLGLADDAEDFPHPDYQLSVADVYRSFASVLVTQGRGADVLALTHDEFESRASTSWVPDWEWSFSAVNLQEHPDFSAGRDRASFHVEAANCDLSTKGLIIDTVMWTFPPEKRILRLSHDLSTFDKLLDLVRRTAMAVKNDPEVLKGHFPSISVADLQLMLIRYLVFDHDGGRFIAAEVRQFSSTVEGAAAKVGLDPSGNLAGDFIARALSEHLNRGRGETGLYFLTCLLEFAQQGTFAITATGRLCFTVADVELGDKIAIILGCRAPYVLREDGDGFLKIGQTYIRGLMHGEALDDERYELQEILLH